MICDRKCWQCFILQFQLVLDLGKYIRINRKNLLGIRNFQMENLFSFYRYIIGSETARAFGKWQCALRVTPILGVLAVILIYYIREPDRGQSEGTHHLEATSYKEDLVGWFFVCLFGHEERVQD